MEGHPEEDDHSIYQAEGHDALLCLFLGKFLNSSRSTVCSLVSILLDAFGVTEGAAEGIVDGDRQNERCTCNGKREVVSIIAGIAQSSLSILLNLNGSGRCKQGTDIDGHIENREACIALVLILRIVIEVAHHHLQVTLEESCTKTNEQQGSQHDYQCHSITTQGYRQQQVAGKHDDDTRGHHTTKAELVGHHTTNEWEKIHKHEKRTVDGACHSGRQSVVGSQEQSEYGQHGVVTKALACVGQCQRK